MQPTYRLLNKPLTLCGCDRKAFMVALAAGLVFFLMLNSFWVGVFTFVVFFGLGRVYTTDPIRYQMLFGPRRHRKDHYNPGLRRPFVLTFHD